MDFGLCTCKLLAQKKMLVLVNGNKLKIDRQQHISTSNFVSANSFIAKFTTYDASLHKCVRLDLHTVRSDTIFIQIYMDAPQGVPGVSKKIKLLSSCAKIEPKHKEYSFLGLNLFPFIFFIPIIDFHFYFV